MCRRNRSGLSEQDSPTDASRKSQEIRPLWKLNVEPETLILISVTLGSRDWIVKNGNNGHDELLKRKLSVTDRATKLHRTIS